MRREPSHADIYAQLEVGRKRFATMDEKLDQIIAAQASLAEAQGDMARQLGEVKETADATKDVVEAWDTARNVGRFIKWVAPVMTAIVVAWGAIVFAIKQSAADILR